MESLNLSNESDKDKWFDYIYEGLEEDIYGRSLSAEDRAEVSFKKDEAQKLTKNEPHLSSEQENSTNINCQDSAVKQYEQVQKENEILRRRVSELFRTAKVEIERKDNQVNELRKQLDDLLLKRNRPLEQGYKHTPVDNRKNEHHNRPPLSKEKERKQPHLDVEPSSHKNRSSQHFQDHIQHDDFKKSTNSNFLGQEIIENKVIGGKTEKVKDVIEEKVVSAKTEKVIVNHPNLFSKRMHQKDKTNEKLEPKLVKTLGPKSFLLARENKIIDSQSAVVLKNHKDITICPKNGTAEPNDSKDIILLSKMVDENLKDPRGSIPFSDKEEILVLQTFKDIEFAENVKNPVVVKSNTTFLIREKSQILTQDGKIVTENRKSNESSTKQKLTSQSVDANSKERIKDSKDLERAEIVSLKNRTKSISEKDCNNSLGFKSTQKPHSTFEEDKTSAIDINIEHTVPNHGDINNIKIPKKTIDQKKETRDILSDLHQGEIQGSLRSTMQKEMGKKCNRILKDCKEDLKKLPIKDEPKPRERSRSRNRANRKDLSRDRDKSKRDKYSENDKSKNYNDKERTSSHLHKSRHDKKIYDDSRERKPHVTRERGRSRDRTHRDDYSRNRSKSQYEKDYRHKKEIRRSRDRKEEGKSDRSRHRKDSSDRSKYRDKSRDRSRYRDKSRDRKDISRHRNSKDYRFNNLKSENSKSRSNSKESTESEHTTKKTVKISFDHYKNKRQEKEQCEESSNLARKEEKFDKIGIEGKSKKLDVEEMVQNLCESGPETSRVLSFEDENSIDQVLELFNKDLEISSDEDSNHSQLSKPLKDRDPEDLLKIKERLLAQLTNDESFEDGEIVDEEKLIKDAITKVKNEGKRNIKKTEVVEKNKSTKENVKKNAQKEFNIIEINEKTSKEKDQKQNKENGKTSPKEKASIKINVCQTESQKIEASSKETDLQPKKGEATCYTSEKIDVDNNEQPEFVSLDDSKVNDLSDTLIDGSRMELTMAESKINIISHVVLRSTDDCHPSEKELDLVQSNNENMGVNETPQKTLTVKDSSVEISSDKSVEIDSKCGKIVESPNEPIMGNKSFDRNNGNPVDLQSLNASSDTSMMSPNDSTSIKRRKRIKPILVGPATSKLKKEEESSSNSFLESLEEYCKTKRHEPTKPKKTISPKLIGSIIPITDERQIREFHKLLKAAEKVEIEESGVLEKKETSSIDKNEKSNQEINVEKGCEIEKLPKPLPASEKKIEIKREPRNLPIKKIKPVLTIQENVQISDNIQKNDNAKKKSDIKKNDIVHIIDTIQPSENAQLNKLSKNVIGKTTMVTRSSKEREIRKSVADNKKLEQDITRLTRQSTHAKNKKPTHSPLDNSELDSSKNVDLSDLTIKLIRSANDTNSYEISTDDEKGTSERIPNPEPVLDLKNELKANSEAKNVHSVCLANNNRVSKGKVMESLKKEIFGNQELHFSENSTSIDDSSASKSPKVVRNCPSGGKMMDLLKKEVFNNQSLPLEGESIMEDESIVEKTPTVHKTIPSKVKMMDLELHETPDGRKNIKNEEKLVQTKEEPEKLVHILKNDEQARKLGNKNISRGKYMIRIQHTEDSVVKSDSQNSSSSSESEEDKKSSSCYQKVIVNRKVSVGKRIDNHMLKVLKGKIVEESPKMNEDVEEKVTQTIQNIVEEDTKTKDSSPCKSSPKEKYIMNNSVPYIDPVTPLKKTPASDQIMSNSAIKRKSAEARMIKIFGEDITLDSCDTTMDKPKQFNSMSYREVKSIKPTTAETPLWKQMELSDDSSVEMSVPYENLLQVENTKKDNVQENQKISDQVLQEELKLSSEKTKNINTVEKFVDLNTEKISQILSEEIKLKNPLNIKPTKSSSPKSKSKKRKAKDSPKKNNPKKPKSLFPTIKLRKSPRKPVKTVSKFESSSDDDFEDHLNSLITEKKKIMTKPKTEKLDTPKITPKRRKVSATKNSKKSKAPTPEDVKSLENVDDNTPIIRRRNSKSLSPGKNPKNTSKISVDSTPISLNKGNARRSSDKVNKRVAARKSSVLDETFKEEELLPPRNQEVQTESKKIVCSSPLINFENMLVEKQISKVEVIVETIQQTPEGENSNIPVLHIEETTSTLHADFQNKSLLNFVEAINVSNSNFNLLKDSNSAGPEDKNQEHPNLLAFASYLNSSKLSTSTPMRTTKTQRCISFEIEKNRKLEEGVSKNLPNLSNDIKENKTISNSQNLSPNLQNSPNSSKKLDNSCAENQTVSSTNSQSKSELESSTNLSSDYNCSSAERKRKIMSYTFGVGIKRSKTRRPVVELID